MTMERQEQLEREMHDGGIDRYYRTKQRASDAGADSETQAGRRLVRDLVMPVATAIADLIERKTARGGRTQTAVLYLEYIPTEVAAYLAIKTMLDNIGKEVAVQDIAVQLGQRVEDQVRFTRLENCAPAYLKTVKERLSRQRATSMKHHRNVLIHAEKRLADGEVGYVFDVQRWQAWGKPTLVHIGMTLLDVAMSVLEIDGLPIFHTVQRARKPTILAASASLLQWMEKYDDVMSEVSPALMPCVHPPRDWTSANVGGYHTAPVANRVRMVKVHDKRMLGKYTRKQMPEVYDAVNWLQSQPWRVNTKLLEVADEILVRGLGYGLPSREPIQPDPAPIPDAYAELRGGELKEAMTDEQWRAFCQWKRDANDKYTAERERSSKYAAAHRVIAQARKFRDEAALYFVHTLDSRGRVYAVSSLLNPQGSDLQKALIEPRDSCLLGETGLYWMIVHGANLYGYDKASFDERVAWCEGQGEDWLDIAANPLQFRGWLDADKPWSFLAWCFTYAELTEHLAAGGDAQDFSCRMYVAMDGSCSGIQHYSAMLRDSVGGREVNLTPGEVPRDIYAAVAEVLKQSLQKIADLEEVARVKSGGRLLSATEQSQLAEKWLAVGINRSLAKKPVMTLPYGSTQLTCRDSLQQYLKDMDTAERELAEREGRPAGTGHPFTPTELDQALSVCSSHLWSSIGEVVVAARLGMDFIRKLASAVSRANTALTWTTPTGFLVKQEEWVEKAIRVETHLHGALRVTLLEPTDKIDANRMRNASAPNFVHSMDAAHLIKSVNASREAGVPCMTVIHDSFGAPPGHVETMRQCVRDQFASMYQESDVLRCLLEETEDRLGVDLGIEPPPPGNLDLEEVRRSPYFVA